MTQGATRKGATMRNVRKNAAPKITAALPLTVIFLCACSNKSGSNMEETRSAGPGGQAIVLNGCADLGRSFQ